MTKTDVKQFIDNAIQNYDIPADLYDSVLDAATTRAWAIVDTKDDLATLDIDTLLGELLTDTAMALMGKRIKGN